LLPEKARKHVFDVDIHLLDALVGDDFKRRHGPLAYFYFHHALVQLAFAKLRAQKLRHQKEEGELVWGCC